MSRCASSSFSSFSLRLIQSRLAFVDPERRGFAVAGQLPALSLSHRKHTTQLPRAKITRVPPGAHLILGFHDLLQTDGICSGAAKRSLLVVSGDQRTEFRVL